MKKVSCLVSDLQISGQWEAGAYRTSLLGRVPLTECGGKPNLARFQSDVFNLGHA